jgi:hypothetical protein
MIMIYGEALAAANDKSRRLWRLVLRSCVYSDGHSNTDWHSSYDKCTWRRLDPDYVFRDMSETREGGAT